MRLRYWCLIAAALVGGCSANGTSTRSDSATVRTQGAATRLWNPDTWQPPAVDTAPHDPYGASVYRGLALVTHTHDSLPGYVGGNMNCTSCHLDEGRRGNAAPLAGVIARFPKFLDRSGAVVTVEDRVNYCFTRSLAGSKLPSDSREMQDIVAYLAFLSRGVPNGEHVRAEGLEKMPALTGDSSRGVQLFADNCARCHGPDGAGVGPVPALWGAKSFSIGASMARPERAASFIRHNMPFDKPGTLTDQQSFDVAAYVTSMTRPDSPGKENDWPAGGAPADVPYDTKGHTAAHRPKVLPRLTNAAAAIVAAPASVIHPR